MAKYNISFTFEDNNSLNDIFIKVLLREISNLKVEGLIETKGRRIKLLYYFE